MKKYFAISVIFLLFSCSHKESTVTHVVLFWLKNPENLEQSALLVNNIQSLKTIPGLISLDMGKAPVTPHTIEENDFDYAATMTFSSQKALKNYIPHPLHQKVNNDIQPLLKAIKVYDFKN